MAALASLGRIDPMCGITGLVNLTCSDAIDGEKLQRAIRTLAHRGPNDEGIHIDDHAGLAARRLSIIDVEGGHQPVANEDGSIHVALNGEIYNHGALRRELEARGHEFKSRVDTEVIVHAYEEWGVEGCLERLRGMFAFGLWDRNTRTMLVARDRLGIKPLFYTEYAGRLYFSSEIRGMLLLSGRPPRLDTDSLQTLMTTAFVHNPHSMFEGVRKLQPAHYLLARNARVTAHRYWHPFGKCEPPRTMQEAADGLQSVLRDSVGCHLESEVPLGSLLSGGIDSALLVGLMKETTTEPIQTVSIGFDLGQADESQEAHANARFFGTDHHHVLFTGDSFDSYPRLLYQLEEPIVDAIFTTFYRLFEACRKQDLTVVINGGGADEAFAGYYWHRRDTWLKRILALPQPLRRLLANSPRFRSRSRLKAVLLADDPSTHQRYKTWQTISNPLETGLLRGLLSPEISERTPEHPALYDEWAERLADAEDETELGRMLWLQAQTRLVDRSNHHLDRMSMAHSIEVRVPFLDHKVWEYAMAIPDAYKVHRRGLKYEEKHILREASRGVIPEETRVRRKKGLWAPYEDWLRMETQPEWVREMLSDDQIKKTGIFDLAAVRQLQAELKAHQGERTGPLMSVLAVQTWAHQFLERPLADGPEA